MSAGGPSLQRSLGLGDAITIGLASMVGAGVFAAFAPAAAAAGSGLLIGLVIAAFVAYCNGTASAQLAAQYPTSGGTYVFGREQLGPWWGFVAGWGFVIGKTASCAAMALTFAAHVAPDGWQRPLALLAVISLGSVNYCGVSRTARLARVILVVALISLAVVVSACALGGSGDLSLALPSGSLSSHGVLQSAGLLFFAFAGYARIATMGEEVREPERTIPRAILTALGLTVAIYAVVGMAILSVLGPGGVAAADAPWVEALDVSGQAWATPLVRVGAAAASLGALLALMAGIGRTTLAMARENDLPRWLASIHPRFRVPHRAEIALTVVVAALVLVADLRAAIGFSSAGVLLYYLVANLAAFTQTAEHRRFPRSLQALGAAGCAILVVTLPWQSVLIGLVVVCVGVAYRLTRRSAGETGR
jgi:APA family basic amino acid/polyamine antiporter